MTEETSNTTELDLKDIFSQGQPSSSKYPTLEIDYALYEEYLDGSDLNDEEKREFLDVLWNIIVNFVDLGFGVHPVQQVQTACGQNKQKTASSKSDSSRVLNSNDSPENKQTDQKGVDHDV